MKGKKIIMKKLGFTLAEVLITLVIIGVIAAMTVPTLMNNTNAQEFRSALKKAISGLNQALTLHYALEGETASDFLDSSANEAIVTNVFKKRMSIIDSSSFPVVSGTAGKLATDCSGKAGDNIWTTADGMKFCITSEFVGTASDGQNVLCNTYNTYPCISGNSTSGDLTGKPNLFIDVNGDRKPNTLTTASTRPKDVYSAMIFSQKVLPWGAAAQEVMFDKQVETK